MNGKVNFGSNAHVKIRFRAVPYSEPRFYPGMNRMLASSDIII